GGPPAGGAAGRAPAEPQHPQCHGDRGRPRAAGAAGPGARRSAGRAGGGGGGFRDPPRGALRLNVPVIVARAILPPIAAGFLAAHPEVTLEVFAEDSFVDVLAAGFDAGVRYDERLEQDMIPVPIGPRVQRFATAAAPSYLATHGRPVHPTDLPRHACLRGAFHDRPPFAWEFEKDGEI